MSDWLCISEFNDVFAFSDQLDNRERKVRKPQRVGGPFFIKKSLKRFRIGVGRKFESVLRRYLHDTLPPFWNTNDPSERGKSFCLQELHRHFIGRYHKIFDKLVCTIAFLDLH